jgi:hypothetical protein
MLLAPIRWFLGQLFQVVAGLVIGVIVVLWSFRWIPLVPVPVMVELVRGEGPKWRWLRPSEVPPELMQAFRWRLTETHQKRLSPAGQAAATLLFPNPEKAVGAEALGSLLLLLWGEERLYHLYLSSASWGPHLWGAKSAAAYYLQKEPQDLSPADIAELILLREFPQAAQGATRPPWFQKQKQALVRQIAHAAPNRHP